MRLWKDIKTYPVIDGWHTSEDGFRVKIGNWATIGDWAKIGDEAKIGNGAKIGDEATIGDCFPQIWIIGKWWLHPYAPGKVRLGCYIGDYETLLNRKQSDWDEHDYTAAHVQVILASLNYLKSIEHLVWDTSEVAA